MRYVAVSALSHEGLLRDHNEDSLAIGPWTICAAVTRTPETLVFPLGRPVVVAAADGLGGHPAGDLASSLVVQRLSQVGPQLDDEAAVHETMAACNRLVHRESLREPDRIAMGTTVAGIVVTEDSVLVFNVGDSRVYAIDGPDLVQVSVDDSPPLAAGQTHTPIVTQTLGGAPDLTAVEAHVSTHPLSDDGRYLICTDGLTDAVDDEALARLLDEHRGGEAAYELWRAAMEAGGPDNITVAVVELGAG